MIQSDVTPATDSVFVLFGVDATPLLSDDRRQLLRSSSAASLQHKKLLMGHHHRLPNSHTHRKTSEEDFLLYYGGNVPVNYAGFSTTATWDQKFYMMGAKDPDKEMLVYVWDGGNEFKYVEVIRYYQNPGDIPRQEYGILTFSDSESSASISNLALFTFNASGVPRELPFSAGGYISPVIYTYGQIGGQSTGILIGGFNQIAYEWSEDEKIFIRPSQASKEDVELGVSALTIEMYAYDDELYSTANPSDPAGFDWTIFLLDLSDNGSIECITELDGKNDCIAKNEGTSDGANFLAPWTWRKCAALILTVNFLAGFSF